MTNEIRTSLYIVAFLCFVFLDLVSLAKVKKGLVLMCIYTPGNPDCTRFSQIFSKGLENHSCSDRFPSLV